MDAAVFIESFNQIVNTFALEYNQVYNENRNKINKNEFDPNQDIPFDLLEKEFLLNDFRVCLKYVGIKYHDDNNKLSNCLLFSMTVNLAAEINLVFLFSSNDNKDSIKNKIIQNISYNIATYSNTINTMIQMVNTLKK